MAALEGLLSDATLTEDKLHDIIAAYDDIDAEKAMQEIRMLPDLCSAHSAQSVASRENVSKPTTAIEWANFFASQPDTVRQLFRDTIKIVSILATAASAERTFSALRRLKTWLRQTMTQKRLTHLALIHCHRERGAKCHIKRLGHEFSNKTSERRTTFGF